MFIYIYCLFLKINYCQSDWTDVICNYWRIRSGKMAPGEWPLEFNIVASWFSLSVLGTMLRWWFIKNLWMTSQLVSMVLIQSIGAALALTGSCGIKHILTTHSWKCVDHNMWLDQTADPSYWICWLEQIALKAFKLVDLPHPAMQSTVSSFCNMLQWNEYWNMTTYFLNPYQNSIRWHYKMPQSND